MASKDVEVQEREWTDQFGTHYEVRARSRDGRIHSQHVMRFPDGWPAEREQAYDNVLALALVSVES